MAFEPRAKFQITADGSDYKRKLRAALNDTNRFAGSVKKALRVGAVAGAAALTATTIALSRLTSEAAKSADALAKQADVLGITTQKLAAYQLAARLSGSSNDGFEKGLRKLQKSIIDATNGLTTYTRAFDALKLDPNELKELTPDQQFDTLAKAFAGVETQAERVAIAYDLFGGRNTALLNTLVLTGNQMNKLEADTKAWGVAISRVDAKQIENANDAAERAKTAFLGLGTNIAIAIAPLRGSLANAFADSAAEAKGFKDEIQATMEALVAGANFAANSVRGIQLAFLGAKLAMLRIQEATARGGGAGASTASLASRIATATGEPDPTTAAQRQTTVTPKRSRILDEIDATARAMDALAGKFQSAEQAVANFRNVQAEALATAQAQVSGQDNQPLIEQFLFGSDFEERMQERQDQLVAMHEQTAQRLVDADRRTAEQRAKIEEKLQATVGELRENALQTGIALLQALGARSKAFAVAAIAVEKALAVQKILISSRVAAAAALEPPPIGLGPVAGAALAASILTAGRVSAALTAALGVAQIANLGSGSTGAPLGTPTNPLFTDNTAQQEPVEQPRTLIEIHVHGDVLTEDRLELVLGRVFDRDGVLIKSNSRQAQAIRGPV